jgi:hypothetical protein
MLQEAERISGRRQRGEGRERGLALGDHARVVAIVVRGVMREVEMDLARRETRHVFLQRARRGLDGARIPRRDGDARADAQPPRAPGAQPPQRDDGTIVGAGDAADLVVQRARPVDAHGDEQARHPAREHAAHQALGRIGILAGGGEVEHREPSLVAYHRVQYAVEVGPRHQLAAAQVDPREPRVAREHLRELGERRSGARASFPEPTHRAAQMALLGEDERELERPPQRPERGARQIEREVAIAPHQRAPVGRSAARPDRRAGASRRRASRSTSSTSMPSTQAGSRHEELFMFMLVRQGLHGSAW